MNWGEEREAMENERTPSKGVGITPTTDFEYQQQWEYELKRLIWNAKMVAKRLHTLENRSAEAWAIRELLNYISEHDVTRYMEIELKIKQEENDG